MNSLLLCWWIGFAGFFGAIARYLIGSVCNATFRVQFPIGTVIVNVLGCAFLGWFLAIARARGLSDMFRIAIAAGFVGAFTTFSTFAYESDVLFKEGFAWRAMLNVVGSIVLGILAVRGGVWLAAR